MNRKMNAMAIQGSRDIIDEAGRREGMVVKYCLGLGFGSLQLWSGLSLLRCRWPILVVLQVFILYAFLPHALSTLTFIEILSLRSHLLLHGLLIPDSLSSFELRLLLKGLLAYRLMCGVHNAVSACACPSEESELSHSYFIDRLNQLTVLCCG